MLKEKILKYNPKADITIFDLAYNYSFDVLNDIKDEYSNNTKFEESLKVVDLLISLKLDSKTLAAAMLSDCLVSKAVAKDVKEKFGQEIYTLILNVNKTSDVDFSTKNKEEYSENIRKLLLASAKDLRIIVIKLAKRVVLMQQLKYYPEDLQKTISQETLNIYSPIAHKLGINLLKSELEDLSLKFLNPEIFQKIKSQIKEKKNEREVLVNELIKDLNTKIAAFGIEKYVVYGRAKSFYSIYKKMVNRGHSFDEIFDLIAVRVITNSTEDCYKILGILHSNWKIMKKGFTDFIANPKPNGYRSIHTKILYRGKIVEVQIRSKEMHFEAEEGIAAHWRYKGTDRDKKFDQKIAWLKQILEWKRTSAATDFIESLKVDLFKDEIVVLTPKGDPISLPEGSTPLDFAYEVHSQVGNKCARVKVNNSIAPLDYILKSGDVVEILTQKNAKPSRQWLKYVITSQAKSKIRQALGLQFEDGKIKKSKITVNSNDFDITNIKLNNCCELIKGQPIIGFQMKDGRVSVHSRTCTNLNMDLSKVSIHWKDQVFKTTNLIITTKDRMGLLKEILDLFSSYSINLTSVNTKTKRDHVIINISFSDINEDIEKELIRTIKQIEPVMDVQEA